jgi:hypothetical protein
MYNRQPRKAIDHEILTAIDNVAETVPSETNTTEPPDAVIDELLDIRAQFHDKARNNIYRAQQRQKEYYDSRHDSNSHRMGGKLESKWDGPYTVDEKLSKGRYRLMSKQGVVLKKLYSGCLLKEYFEPVEASALSDQVSPSPDHEGLQRESILSDQVSPPPDHEGLKRESILSDQVSPPPDHEGLKRESPDHEGLQRESILSDQVSPPPDHEGLKRESILSDQVSPPPDHEGLKRESTLSDQVSPSPDHEGLLYSLPATQDVLRRRAVLARKGVNFVPADVILAMGAQISRQNMGIW